MNLAKIEAAAAWARKREREYVPSLSHHQALLSLRPWFERCEPRSILDVGSGRVPNVISGLCGELGISYTGLDVLGLGATAGDVHDLPFGDRAFDLVLSREGPEHYLIPVLALMEMARVSKHWLIVGVPADNLRCGESPGHISLLCREGWETLYRLLKLRIVERADVDVTDNENRPQVEWRWLLEVGR